MAGFFVVDYRGRTTPGCDCGLVRSLVFMVCRIQSHSFVKKRGYPLNLALQSSSDSLGLEL